jgi:hypothetical protein
MLYKKLLFFMFFLFAALCGCSTNQYDGCKPVLMPYGEYSYKAVSIKLSGDFVRKADEIIDFHGLKVAVPQGWHCEKVSAEKAIKFFNNKSRFLLIFEKNVNIQLDTELTYMIGCKNFVIKNKDKTKTQKEFYTDLYLFTDDKLDSDPIFWQYHILWCKTEFLRNTEELFHYTGDNLEAFQRNYRQDCKKGSLLMQSEIFPQSIAPDYLVIASRFKDDSFFVEFIEMLNAMNPIDKVKKR